MSKRQFHIKAIITDKRGKTLSIGENSYVKTHPVQARHAEKVGLPHKTFLHAEIHAIVKCRRLDLAHKISIFRYDRAGNPKPARPCPVCLSAIKEAGIEAIEHT